MTYDDPKDINGEQGSPGYFGQARGEPFHARLQFNCLAAGSDLNGPIDYAKRQENRFQDNAVV